MTCLYFLLSPGVFLFGGSAMASQIVATAQMNLRHVRLVIAPLASSSVRMATVPTPASSATATRTAPTAPTRTLLSAV